MSSDKLSDDDIWNYLLSVNAVTSVKYNTIEKEVLLKLYHEDYKFVETNFNRIDHITKIHCFNVAIVLMNQPMIDKLLNLLKPFYNKMDNTEWIETTCRGISGCSSDIEYILQRLNVKIAEYACPRTGRTILHIICQNCIDVNILSYFTKTYKQLLDVLDNDGNSCLSLASAHGKNVEVIKFLVEEKQMDPFHIDYKGVSCVKKAMIFNTNSDICVYMMEKSNYFVQWNDIIMDNSIVNKILKCNDLSKIFASLMSQKKTSIFGWLIANLPKIVIPVKIRKLFNINANPYNEMFCDFIKSVEHLKYLIPLELCEYDHEDSKYNNNMVIDSENNGADKSDGENDGDYSDNCDDENDDLPPLNNEDDCVEGELRDNETKLNSDQNDDLTSEPIIDFRKKTELLFKVGGEEYYGHCEAIFRVIDPFRQFCNQYQKPSEIISSVSVPSDTISTSVQPDENKDCIEININASPNIINMYIAACIGSDIDFKKIKGLDDFKSMLELLDRYRILHIQFHTLEHDIVKWMQTKQVVPDDYMRGLSKRYKLKHMCVYIHNFDLRHDLVERSTEGNPRKRGF